jgi:HPt (histidine-containing phosphotransfer) domain-containing protein
MTTSHAHDQSTEIFDREQVLGVLDGNLELFGELVQLFQEDSVRLLAEMRRALASRSGEDVRRAAHTLRGAVSNFRAARVADVVLRLEMRGREGDLATAEVAFQETERAIADLLAALAAATPAAANQSPQ